LLLATLAADLLALALRLIALYILVLYFSQF